MDKSEDQGVLDLHPKPVLPKSENPVDESEQKSNPKSKSKEKSELPSLQPKPLLPNSEKPVQKSKQPVLKKPKAKNLKPKVNKKKSVPKSKSKQSFHRPLPKIGPRDNPNYRNMSLISRFISDEGKILPRRVSRLTLKQHAHITRAIKQARILSLLPFLRPKKKDPKKKEKPFERVRPKSTPRAKNQKGPQKNKKNQNQKGPQKNKKNQNSNL